MKLRSMRAAENPNQARILFLDPSFLYFYLVFGLYVVWIKSERFKRDI